MQLVTLVIATFGAVTGGLSLAWAVRSFYLSEAKVTVHLQAGRMGHPGVLVYPLAGNVIAPSEAEYPESVLIVTASNSGRLPIAVTTWQIRLGPANYTLPNAPESPSLPHLLGVGEQASWFVPWSELRPACVAVEKTTGTTIQELRAAVTLANGLVCESQRYPLLPNAQ